MKILVVTTSYPRWPGDAAGNFVAARVERLRQEGHEVIVLAAAPAQVSESTVSEIAVSEIVVRLGGPATAALFGAEGAPERFEAAAGAAWLGAIDFWGALVRELRDRLPRVDAVESHWLVPASLAIAALGYRGPHRAHAHSGDVALLERLAGGRSLARALLAARAEMVFASHDLKARFTALVSGHEPRRASLLATARVEPAQSELVARPPARLPFAERRRRQSVAGLAAPVILAVGRLVAIKGHDRLVRAVARLPRQTRPSLVIVGEGPACARLRQMALDREVDLRLTGAVSVEEVGRWLTLADCFVHPSRQVAGRSEGTPVAVREALAAGLDVIATGHGGVAALATEPAIAGRLRLVPDGDACVTELARALSETLAAVAEPSPSSTIR